MPYAFIMIAFKHGNNTVLSETDQQTKNKQTGKEHNFLENMDEETQMFIKQLRTYVMNKVKLGKMLVENIFVRFHYLLYKIFKKHRVKTIKIKQTNSIKTLINLLFSFIKKEIHQKTRINSLISSVVPEINTKLTDICFSNLKKKPLYSSTRSR